MAFRVGRRVFLRSLAGAGLALPFLPSLLPREAQAQAYTGPKRFVGVLGYSGQFVRDYYPTRTPAGYQLRDTKWGSERADGTTALNDLVPGTSSFHRAPLSDFAEGGISETLTDSLNPYLDKMLLLRGLDLLQGTSHGYGMFLGNLANCASSDAFDSRGLGERPTVDQILAYSDRFYSSAPKMRSLPLATGSPGSVSYTDYGIPGGSVEQLNAYIDPHDVWQDLFGDFMAPDQPRENPNRSLMNAIHADYARVRDHRRLGVEDKATLERHMAFLADIERELGTTAGAGCIRPDEPPRLEVGYPWEEVSSIADFQLTVSLLVDMAVAAIRCDLTRIVTMSVDMALTDASGSLVNSYHNSADVAGDWHDYSHREGESDNARQNIIALNRWVASEVFGQFLAQLDVEEADGRTFLDNSLVALGGELAMDHYVISQPTLLAGSAGGALQTGHYVDYTQLDHDYANSLDPWGILIPGIPYNRFYVTVLQAMGLQPSDYERDGQRGYGHTEMFDGPYNWPDDAYDMNAIGEPLPGLFVE